MAGANSRDRHRWSERAEAGELILDPEIGTELARACGDFLAHLESVHDMVERISVVDGFGPFPSGRALREKFSLKGTGTPGSIDAVLREHIETVRLVARTVAVSLADTSEVDRSTGRRIMGVVR